MIRIIEKESGREYLDQIFKRSQFEYEDVNRKVDEIIKEVRDKKDYALLEYTLMFDGADLSKIEVSQEEKDKAFSSIDPSLEESLLRAKENIEDFHKNQLKEGYMMKKGDGIIVGQIARPIKRAGVYVPGGSAAYPSTVLMNAIPAKIAGVEEIIMVTPPGQDGKLKDSIIVAASMAGIDRIYKVGGAQAIAALTYGTESVPKVDKIVGPGNIFVAMAKKKVSYQVGIDMVAGPSEILIIADQKANPRYIAADLISQAEHDAMAASILVTDSPSLAKRVKEELEVQIGKLKRDRIIRKSLEDYGAIIISSCLSDSIDIANEIAPEHLQIMTANPFDVYKKIENAGAIFLGEYTPEPVGDYFAGPNHTLPTSSTSKFASALCVDDFIKKSSLIYYSREALFQAKDHIINISTDEGLSGHSNSISIRFEDEE